MLKDDPLYNPDPCLIQNWVAWTTKFPGQMRINHQQVELFYLEDKKELECSRPADEGASKILHLPR